MGNEVRLVIGAFEARFKDQKQTAEKAVAQVSDAQLHVPLDENTNSLAVIMKHMAGNLRSRFADFLTSDGEKPGRDRDSEFVDEGWDRAAIMADWESGWKALFGTLAGLNEGDLGRMVAIRGQGLTVVDALARAMAHQGYHVGQIVQLARYLAKEKWTTMTIPRGGSKGFNEGMREKFGK